MIPAVFQRTTEDRRKLVVTRFNTEAPYGAHRQQFPLLKKISF